MEDNQPFNIVDLLEKAAQKTPDKTALIYKNKKVTFGEFAASIDQTAAYFLKKGIQKGDRVMVFVPMSDDLYRIVLALFKIGAVAVFLDEWVSLKRLNVCCKLAHCKAFISTTKGRILAWFVPGLRQIPLHLGVDFDKNLVAANLPKTLENDIALITFTTGSTGNPKAAIRTHGLLREQFLALQPILEFDPADICMPALPIVLLLNLGAGVTSVIPDFNARKPGSLKSENIIDQIETHAVTSIIASPFFVKEISKHLSKKHLTLPHIQKIFTGGAPVFPSEATLYRNAFPDTNIQIVYGSTEAEPISSVDADVLIENQDEKGLLVGMPEPAATVKIIQIRENLEISTQKELEGIEVTQGEIGEIIVSGKHVLRAYLHNEEALKRNKIFIGETCWHRTGDSGYFGPDGNLYLTGRCNTLIFNQNEIVSPFMYENYFQTLEGIEMGTILMLAGKITAIIELKNSRFHDNVKQTLEKEFEKILFIKKIPRDPRHNSKIDYERLRRLAGQYTFLNS
ncbi:AMP-binding protein [Dyadobacter luticola]|nr:AMP-binding protein [Dyadobacter luticola]